MYSVPFFLWYITPNAANANAAATRSSAKATHPPGEDSKQKARNLVFQLLLYLQWKTNKHNITITHTQKVSLPGSTVLWRVPRLTLASFTSLSERPTEQEGSEVEERRSQLWTKKSPEDRFLYTRLWGFTSCFLSDQRSTGCGYQPSDSQLTFTLSSSPHTTDRKGGLPEAR